MRTRFFTSFLILVIGILIGIVVSQWYYQRGVPPKEVPHQIVEDAKEKGREVRDTINQMDVGTSRPATNPTATENSR